MEIKETLHINVHKNRLENYVIHSLPRRADARESDDIIYHICDA